MAKTLTAKSVEQAQPGPARREIPDAALPAFYLVVQPSGMKSWAVRYRARGKPRKHTLGSYPALDLGTAREAARAALRAVAEGRDPAAEKASQNSDTARERDLFKNVVDEFLARHMKGKRSAAEVERMLRVDVLPRWGERRIQEITKRDVLELLDGLTDRGVGPMTNRVFAAVRKLFNFCLARDMIASSPCAGIRPPVPEVSRDRVLTDDEIRAFWGATGRMGYPFGPLFRLLLLTGQRLSEVGEMTWAELDLSDRLWTIPRQRAKNDVAHGVPLSEVAMGIIGNLPRVAGPVGYVFTTNGRSPVSGWSRAKRNLDREMGATTPWRLHDLRRTCASGMARLGINLPVIEKVLNHTSGSFAGIVGVYQRHSFADEKRRALEAWGSFVVGLSSEQPAVNIVRLAG